MLLLEFTESLGLIRTELMLLLSLTSTNEMLRMFCGSIFQRVPAVELRRVSRLLDAPFIVAEFEIMNVFPFWKVSVSALVTDFMRL